MTRRTLSLHTAAILLIVPVLASCRSKPPADRVRASGSVEATEVQVSALVGGRLLEVKVNEGDRVAPDQVIALLDTADTQLAIRRARAERDQAAAQLSLLRAGSRAEDIRQGEAQAQAADADVTGARDDLASAESDLARFEKLLAASSGSEKQRDDAATRRNLARARLQSTEERARAAREALSRLRRGARSQELEAAAARVAAVDAQIATLEKSLDDAVVKAPVSGLVTQKLADAGEIVAPRTPLVTVVDLDHAWANIYVDEPLVPRLRVGQAATIFTDAGTAGIGGTLTFISPKAEFTPRNVQTAEERSKLVYRVKVTVDNRKGVLKQGMPVEAEIPLAGEGR